MQIQSYDTACESFEAMVKGLSSADLPKPTRSTVPFLCYWKGYHKRLPELLGKLNVRMTDDAVLSFEHRVPSLNSRATPSHTDLMVMTSDAAIAIEGKWTEGMYATISKWIADGKYPDSRRKVAEHWVGLIQPFADRTLSLETLPADQIVYQLLHRTASACRMAGTGRAIVLYQIFDDGRGEHSDYGDMLNSFTKYVQPTERLSFRLARCPMKPTPEFLKLEDDCNGKSKTEAAAAIRDALLKHRLFEFWETPIQ